MSHPLINITRKHALTFAVFLVMYEFLTYIANDMIMPGMIEVVRSFHASSSNIATSLTMYVLGGASLQLLLGPVADHCGRRPVMLFGASLFFICTVLVAYTHTINQFLIMRFFEGMGLCFISVIGYTVLQEIFEEMDAVRLIAVMTNVAILAPLLGPLGGAVMIQYLSWHGIFLFIAFFSIIALWGLWRFMPESVGQVRHDGVEIKRVKLSFKNMYINYTQLVCNVTFVFGAIAFGMLGIMCVTWIGLAPVIMVTQAKLTLLQYALWQIPVFGALILGNVILVGLTHHFSLKSLIILGASVSIMGLVLIGFLPMVFNTQYIWLIPGIMVYFLGYGMTGSPLIRYILFSTHVSKGTASALLSTIYMAIWGAGVELGNMLYKSHQNVCFGYYAMASAFIFLMLLIPSLCHKNLKPNSKFLSTKLE